MTDEVPVRLRDARPDDRIHLLLWDTPDETELLRIIHYNNAYRANYRKNLLQRICPGEKFLTLQHNLDVELLAIKSMCSGVSQQIVLLEGFDCLITYLQITPGSRITLFWKQLEETRKLEKLLWILLPQQLAPKNWPSERIKRLPSG